MKTVSVVIVTYNSMNLIVDCLSSLCDNNDIGDDLEIIIVDNSSADFSELSSFLHENYSGIKLISNRENLGYGHGNNIGIREAQGSIILIMNPDIRLIHPIFKDALSIFEEKKSTLLGMKQMETVDKAGFSFRFESLDSSCFIVETLKTVIFNKLDYFNSKSMFISGACFFINKSHFKRIGLFDENIFMYFEEMDIKNRITQMFGEKAILYKKEMKYIHKIGNRGFSFVADKRYIDSQIYFAGKYFLNKYTLLSKSLRKRIFFKFISELKGLRSNVEQFELSIQHIRDLKSTL